MEPISRHGHPHITCAGCRVQMCVCVCVHAIKYSERVRGLGIGGGMAKVSLALSVIYWHITRLPQVACARVVGGAAKRKKKRQV